jgi:hypothetical protein
MVVAGGIKPPHVTLIRLQEARRNPKALNITIEDKSAKENN